MNWNRTYAFTDLNDAAHAEPPQASRSNRMLSPGENAMKIVIEKGKTQWFASTEDCEGLYRGLLVVGGSMDDVIDTLPAAFKDLRTAAARRSKVSRP